MEQIPLRKAKSQFYGRSLFSEELERSREPDGLNPNQFTLRQRVTLLDIPPHIRECLEEFESLGVANQPTATEPMAVTSFKDGKDLLRMLQEARRHQEQKIKDATEEASDVGARSPRRMKPIKKISRKPSRRQEQTAEHEKYSTETLPMDMPPVEIKQIVEFDETQPSLCSLLDDDRHHTDYLGIGSLMF